MESLPTSITKQQHHFNNGDRQFVRITMFFSFLFFSLLFFFFYHYYYYYYFFFVARHRATKCESCATKHNSGPGNAAND
jgi:hypothetical protein